MPNYRRAKITGATWFFTVNLLERHNNNLLIKEIALLKASIKKVYRAHPFEIILSFPSSSLGMHIGDTKRELGSETSKNAYLFGKLVW